MEYNPETEKLYHGIIDQLPGLSDTIDRIPKNPLTPAEKVQTILNTGLVLPPTIIIYLSASIIRRSFSIITFPKKIWEKIKKRDNKDRSSYSY